MNFTGNRGTLEIESYLDKSNQAFPLCLYSDRDIVLKTKDLPCVIHYYPLLPSCMFYNMEKCCYELRKAYMDVVYIYKVNIGTTLQPTFCKYNVCANIPCSFSMLAVSRTHTYFVRSIYAVGLQKYTAK